MFNFQQKIIFPKYFENIKDWTNYYNYNLYVTIWVKMRGIMLKFK